MSSLQPQSLKIKKETPEQQLNDFKQYICGGCNKKYGSYPALYLHIRRKHNGIRPPNTICKKAKQSAQRLKVKIGRPKKSVYEQNEAETPVESANNELLLFLGQDLSVIRDMRRKESLKDIIAKVIQKENAPMDTWLEDLQKESLVFLSKNNERDLSLKNPNLEEDLIHLDPKDRLSVIIWFMMWLAKLYVKLEFIPDLCLIFSRIWKILDLMQLRVADLDNKLVWKRICNESEGFILSLDMVKKDQNLLNELIKKVCCLIGIFYEDTL